MTTHIKILNEGPNNIVWTENGVTLRYLKPNTFVTTVVYKGKSIELGEVPKEEDA